MRPWLKPTIAKGWLILALCLGLLGLFSVHKTIIEVPHPRYAEQLEAARLMERALSSIKDAKIKHGLPINQDEDPNQTGLIGEMFTTITTSSGNLEAKRTGTSPAFAALMVRLFDQAGLTKGDTVAIGASGSFPGLIIATLAACEVMQLEPLLFYSVGSSMYGANLPEYTFPEMLKTLRQEGVLPYSIAVISLGGDYDRGGGTYFPDSIQVMTNIARASGAQFLFPENNEASIVTRLALYAEHNGNRPPDCFVNIGGAVPNMGNTNASLKFPNGLVTQMPLQTEHPERGLIFEYLERGIPVIHLLNIRGLALKSGIAIDPIPFPEIGTEEVYYETAVNVWLIWFSLGIVLMVLLLAKGR